MSPPITAIEDGTYGEPAVPANETQRQDRMFRRRLLTTEIGLRRHPSHPCCRRAQMPLPARIRLLAVLSAASLLTALASASGLAGDLTGSRIETKGTWKVKGKLVVYTDPTGRSSSLRLSEVDLDASTAATTEAATPAAKAEPPAKAAVRPTDADVGHVNVAADEAEGDAPAAAAAAGKAEGRLAVTKWSDETTNGGLVISGELSNPTDATATAVRLEVQLYNEAGLAVAKVAAVVDTTTLPKGQSTHFRAEIPDLKSFASVKFDANATFFGATPKPTPVPGEGTGER